MLQMSLARNHLLVGYGIGKDKPYNTDRTAEGCRPSVFFAPHRDSFSLITRKVHSVLILKRRGLRQGLPSLFLINPPSGELVNISQWKSATETIENTGIRFSWVDMRQSESSVSTCADIYTQVFEPNLPNNGKYPHDGDLRHFTITIDCYISDDSLRERFKIAGIATTEFDAFLLHWHEPEIGVSSFLQETTVDFAHSTLFSHRGGVWFGVSGMESGKGGNVLFAECSRLQGGRSAISRLGDILVHLVAKDSILGFEHVKSLKDSGFPRLLRPTTTAWGQCDGLIMWRWNYAEPFDLIYRFAENEEELLNVPLTDFLVEKEKIEKEDRIWLASKTPAPESLDIHIKNLYHRTLLVLRQMQDPGGGIIAAPEIDFEFRASGGYGFCWGRDAAFTTLAMDTCGLHAESARFYRYIARCQERNGSFGQRHDMKANLGPTWSFQPDETGVILFGLFKHVQMADDKDLAADLKEVIIRAVEWLSSSRFKGTDLPSSGEDLWEENDGIHFYSLAAIVAGLNAAVGLCELMDWSIPGHWKARQAFLRDLVNSKRFLEKTDYWLVRTILRKVSAEQAAVLMEQGEPIEIYYGVGGHREYRLQSDRVVDIALLGAFFPFNVIDAEMRAEFYGKLVHRLDSVLWCDGVGRIGRYKGDWYHGGNSWILATLWLAIAAADCGDIALAKKCFEWSVKHATDEGMFAEQIDPQTGKPVWVIPLCWSHAMFALAVHLLPEECLVDYGP